MHLYGLWYDFEVHTRFVYHFFVCDFRIFTSFDRRSIFFFFYKKTKYLVFNYLFIFFFHDNIASYLRLYAALKFIILCFNIIVVNNNSSYYLIYAACLFTFNVVFILNKNFDLFHERQFS